MKPTQKEVIEIIKDTISKRKGEVINVLIESDVPLGSNLNEGYILGRVLDAINNNNTKLIVKLGKLIDKDLSKDKKSSFLGYNIDITKINKDKDGATSSTDKDGSWWKDNKENILSGISTGAGILSTLLAPKQGGTNGGSSSPIPSEVLAQQQKEEEERLRLEAEKKRKRMIMIGGGIGLLLIAGIVTFVVINKRKNNG